MKNILFFLCILSCVSISPSCHAETNGYKIFGEVTTVDNQTVKGYITWGNRQMYWTDIFHADKLNNPYAHYFKNSGVQFINNTMQSSTPPTHVFICRFGNIKSIRQNTYNRVELQVKDGNIIDLTKGKHLDIGVSLNVYSPSEGNTNIHWEKISKIEFMEADQPDNRLHDVPITGIVKTSQGIYKGIITWNNDKRTQNALLDGMTSSGKNSVPFHSIRQITKTNNACKIALKEGRELEMWGSNDINNQNRGILVSMPNIGTVYVPWKNFEMFEAVGLNEVRMLSYNDFTAPKRLSGSVKMKNGQTQQGILVFDLDEAMNFEILDGSNDNISYAIPFKYVKSIEPKNYKYSFITLTNNGALSLGDKEDVDARNSGLLIFSPNETPVYVPWKEVGQITFQN